MENFIKKKGELTVVVGRGYLTLYEASRLKKGDVIRTNSRAGKPFDAYLNGNFMFSGDVCIAHEFFIFRANGFTSRSNAPAGPGIVDYATEMVPVEIRMGRMRFSLEELSGVFALTSIAMERKFSETEDAELYIAGLPAARGKVAVIGENFGIRITEAYPAEASGVPLRSSGYLVDPLLEKVKDYDFRKPDKFTWEIVARVGSVHKLFLENLKILVPETREYAMLWVDQFAFFELFKDLGGDFSFIIAENKTGTGKLFSGMTIGNKPFIQQEDSENPLPKEYIEVIHSFHQGYKELQSARGEALFIIAIKKESPLESISGESAVRELLLNPLKNSWKNIAALDLDYFSTEEKIENAKIVPDKDMVLVVGFGVKNAECILIYPYISFENILALMD